MDGNIIGAIGLYQKYFMESERMFAGGLSTWMAGLGQIYISMYSNTDIVHKK
jgi:hypothetical protein